MLYFSFSKKSITGAISPIRSCLHKETFHGGKNARWTINPTSATSASYIRFHWSTSKRTYLCNFLNLSRCRHYLSVYHVCWEIVFETTSMTLKELKIQCRRKKRSVIILKRIKHFTVWTLFFFLQEDANVFLVLGFKLISWKVPRKCRWKTFLSKVRLRECLKLQILTKLIRSHHFLSQLLIGL